MLKLREVEELMELPKLGSSADLSDTRGFYPLCQGAMVPLNRFTPNRNIVASGPAVPAWCTANQEILQDGINTFSVEEVWYLPHFGTLISSEGMVFRRSFAEARYQVGSDFKGLPYTEHSNYGTTFAPPDSSRADFGLVFVPWGGIHNYGHFICDALPSILVFADIQLLSRAPVLCAPLKTWQRRHIQLLGIPLNLIEMNDDTCRCGRVIYTDVMDHFLHRSNRFLRMVRDAQMKTLGLSMNKQGTRKLYIARPSNDKRRFVNEDKLISALETIGFDVIAPETLTVDDQILLFSQAQCVVAPTGAALANSLYCAPGTVVVEIQPAGATGIWVRNICSQVAAIWAPYFAESKLPEEIRIIGGIERPDIGLRFGVDVRDVVKHIYAAQPL